MGEICVKGEQTMSEVYMPYLGAIAAQISDAFPNSRQVNVWADPSIFGGEVAITIKAVVDHVGAYTVIYPDSRYTEAHISEVLIALLKERRTDDADNSQI